MNYYQSIKTALGIINRRLTNDMLDIGIADKMIRALGPEFGCTPHDVSEHLSRENLQRLANHVSNRTSYQRKIGPFPDYHDAYDAAVDDARHYKCDIGLEKLNGAFRLFFLPKPENRCGFELRCEVITPDSPRVGRI